MGIDFQSKNTRIKDWGLVGNKGASNALYRDYIG